MLEIEKTYLVKQIPNNLSSFKSHQIKQGYISSTTPPLRIRQNDNQFELTKKIRINPNDFTSHEEINIPLTEFEFNKLWPLVEKYLEKDRYYLPLENNLFAEVNIYKGDLQGLVMVEVEFTSKKEMELFKPPVWFEKDVTQENFSSNCFLAGKNLSEIKKYIEE